MSYARFSEGDIYLFPTGDGIECQHCCLPEAISGLTGTVSFKRWVAKGSSFREQVVYTLVHLGQHERAGHNRSETSVGPAPSRAHRRRRTVTPHPENETWHGGPAVPTIVCVDPDRYPWNRGADWRLWIPPIGPECYEGGNIDTGDVIPPWGDSYWPTQQDACEFLRQYLDTEPVCEAGHPLIVLTKGTFWLTVDARSVQRAVVLVDVGDAGNLDPEPFWIWGCTENGCTAEVTAGAKKTAITRADGMWPCLKMVDGHTHVAIEG